MALPKLDLDGLTPEVESRDSSLGWSLLVTDDGSSTLAHPAHGQACHSSAGAWLESRERYARACRVRERALELVASGNRTLRLLDVGTGLGYNLAAALEALDGTGCALHATTLELERDVIERTLELARDGELYRGAPGELQRFHEPVVLALESALAAHDRATTASSRAARGASEAALGDAAPGDVVPIEVALGDGTLALVLGDGSRTLAALPLEPRFDAVFLDPFSPQVDGVLWQRPFLAEVARRMHERALLSTYSASLGVRAALVAAGLEVAPGARVGPKAQGTLASRTALDVGPGFDERTLRRIARRASSRSAQ